MQICTTLSPRTISPSGENVARPRCGRRRCGKSLGGRGRQYAVVAGAFGARSRARKPPRAGRRCRRGRGLGLGRPSPRATGMAEPPLPIWANGAQPSPPALIADEPRARWPAGLPVASAGGREERRTRGRPTSGRFGGHQPRREATARIPGSRARPLLPSWRAGRGHHRGRDEAWPQDRQTRRRMPGPSQEPQPGYTTPRRPP